MNNKMERFLNSLGIKDIERFDMDFDLVSRNQFIREQIDMFIVKDTPWDYALLEEFQSGLAIIGYPYTLEFSYKRKPTVYDAIRLFDDWHRSHNRYQSEIHLEGSGDIITFIYDSQEQKEKYEQVTKDFEEFLDFLSYRFSFDHEVREKEPEAPSISKRTMQKIESQANKFKAGIPNSGRLPCAGGGRYRDYRWKRERSNGSSERTRRQRNRRGPAGGPQRRKGGLRCAHGGAAAFGRAHI